MVQLSRWMDEMRKRAVDSLPDLSMPKAEKTILKNWGLERFQLDVAAVDAVIPNEIAHLVKEGDSNVIVVVDGALAYKNLGAGLKGLAIFDILNIPEDYLEVFQGHFGKSAPFSANKLAALNLIHLNSGLFIYAPKNSVAEETLSVIFVQKNRSLINRNLIVVEQSAQLRLVETYINTEEASLNLVTEVSVGENGFLSHASIERLHKETTAYSTKRAQVGKQGHYELSHGALSDGNVVTENLVSLAGEGAEAFVNAVAIAEKDQKQNITVMVEHRAPKTAGNIVNHGISQGNAQLVFNGIGKIHRGMKGSNAQQESRVMVLSESARADANPLLLIEEFDVEAGHAAGVGKIDEEQIYYLMSRGLSRQEAEKLIILGFLMPFINDISHESIREELAKTIQSKIA